MKKFILCLIALFLIFGGTANADLNDGLVAYYPFNGNTYDKSGNDFNGNPTDSVTFISTGKVNGAVALTADDSRISIGNYDEFNEMGNLFTIAFWIKTETNNQGGVIIEHDIIGTRSDDWFIQIVGDGNSSIKKGTVIFHFGNANQDSMAISNKSVDDDEWHFIVLKRDITSGNFWIYIDGVLDITVTGKKNDLTTPTDLNIGPYDTPSGWNNTTFRGFFDELRFYNRLLSESEIQELYNDPDSKCPDDRYDEGKQAGIEYCKNNPSACGIDVSGDYDNGYEDGKDFCKNNPSACNITCSSLGCGSGDGGSDDNCATFNFFENTLQIPCFDAGTANYWMDLKIVDSDDSVLFELKDAGPND